MNARRRDNTPPYEIMGNRPSVPQASGRGPRPRSSAGAGISGFFESIADTWRSGASEPLTLRVPRGMAVAMLAGLLGLLVLAYWVGYSRGDSAADKRVRAEYEPALADDGRAPPERSVTAPGTGPGSRINATNNGPGTASAPVTQSDPRVKGNNYLILALYPEEEARRLKAFLAQRQVEVMVGPRNNKGLCQVIALNGFTREQVRDTDAAERFLTKMRALGRDWKAANDNRGDDLASMYYDKYQPPDGR